jgi:lipoprotein NlpI
LFLGFLAVAGLHAADPEAAGELVGQSIFALGLPALITGILARRSKKPWRLWKLVLIYVAFALPLTIYTFAIQPLLIHAHADACADNAAAAKLRQTPECAPAFFNRANAYQARGDLDRALADYDVAIALNPQYANAFNNRGAIFLKKGDIDRAIADYDQAIRFDSKVWQAYQTRGALKLFFGALPEALADLTRASELTPANTTTALWLDIARQRSNQPSRLAEAVPQLDMSKWPAQLVSFYTGQATLEAVLGAADSDADAVRGRLCTANFFIGELALRNGAKADAEVRLRVAAANCPVDYIERLAAPVELRTLGIQP